MSKSLDPADRLTVALAVRALTARTPGLTMGEAARRIATIAFDVVEATEGEREAFEAAATIADQRIYRGPEPVG